MGGRGGLVIGVNGQANHKGQTTPFNPFGISIDVLTQIFHLHTSPDYDSSPELLLSSNPPHFVVSHPLPRVARRFCRCCGQLRTGRGRRRHDKATGIYADSAWRASVLHSDLEGRQWPDVLQQNPAPRADVIHKNFSRRTGANFLFSDPPRWPEHLFTDLEGKPDDFFPDFEVRRRRRRRQEEGVLLEDLAGTRIFEDQQARRNGQ